MILHCINKGAHSPEFMQGSTGYSLYSYGIYRLKQRKEKQNTGNLLTNR